MRQYLPKDNSSPCSTPHCTVLLPATHDTASAFVAVPVQGEDSIFLSSGTCSLIGVERNAPDCREISRVHNFTNEGGYNGTIRYLKNIMGLWMIQSVKKELGNQYSPVLFPDGIGVVGWMVPGGSEIAKATACLMRQYDVAIWAHGIFCSGEDFDLTFGLMDTVEKSAEILVKVLSMGGKRQSITPQNFKDLACAFSVTLPENCLK